MDYRFLGTTGLQVSSLALGTMVLGAWGNRHEEECLRVVNEALDAGVNLVDTADMYAQGETEEIDSLGLAQVIGLGLEPRRSEALRTLRR